MRTIQELSHDTFYKMEKYSQLTIDYVEEVEDILSTEVTEDYTQEDVNLDLMEISANISLVLEIINPILQDDISMLEELQEILEDRLRNVMF